MADSKSTSKKNQRTGSYTVSVARSTKTGKFASGSSPQGKLIVSGASKRGK